jgi:hypothetical protein
MCLYFITTNITILYIHGKHVDNQFITPFNTHFKSSTRIQRPITGWRQQHIHVASQRWWAQIKKTAGRVASYLHSEFCKRSTGSAVTQVGQTNTLTTRHQLPEMFHVGTMPVQTWLLLSLVSWCKCKWRPQNTKTSSEHPLIKRQRILLPWALLRNGNTS